MTQLSPAEWKRLEALATQVGVSPEQVGMVRRRMETNRAHPGHPYTMLIGRPDGGLEVLLAGWIGSEAIQALKQAGEKPLILGREPEQVRPTLSNWPALTWKPCEPGHLIAWRSPGKPGADLLAQLGSLGYVDQLVLVTRLGKPLDQVEREMARSLSPLAVTARVLVVGLAGEEPTADDLAEISAYAACPDAPGWLSRRARSRCGGLVRRSSTGSAWSCVRRGTVPGGGCHGCGQPSDRDVPAGDLSPARGPFQPMRTKRRASPWPPLLPRKQSD